MATEVDEMRKLTVLAALALAVLVAMPAASIEIDSVNGYWPFSVAPATTKVMTYTVARANFSRLPTGVIVWSGDGSALYTRDWMDYSRAAGSDVAPIWAFAPFPLKIPGAKTLPAPQSDWDTSADSISVKIEITCPADSAFGLWTW